MFNGLHQDEITGIVLADATQEDQYELLPRAWSAISAAKAQRTPREIFFFVANMGIGRLMLRAQGGGDNDAYLILTKEISDG